MPSLFGLKPWNRRFGERSSISNSALVTPRTLLANRRLQVPVMLGHTSHEFFSEPQVTTAEEFKELAEAVFGSDAPTFLGLVGFDDSCLDQAIARAAVSSIEYAIRLAGQAHTDSGANTPLYYYNFDAEIPGNDDPGPFHSVDLWFFFETLAKCWRPFVGKHYDLARQMCNYWANFITSGVPNGPDASGELMPKWRAYTAQEPWGVVFRDQVEVRHSGTKQTDGFLGSAVLQIDLPS